jgi:hypothetical protein
MGTVLVTLSRDERVRRRGAVVARLEGTVADIGVVGVGGGEGCTGFAAGFGIVVRAVWAVGNGGSSRSEEEPGSLDGDSSDDNDVRFDSPAARKSGRGGESGEGERTTGKLGVAEEALEAG